MSRNGTTSRPRSKKQKKAPRGWGLLTKNGTIPCRDVKIDCGVSQAETADFFFMSLRLSDEIRTMFNPTSP